MKIMATIEKLIHKMKNQPNGISPEEAGRVLNAKGFLFARQKGSHCHYINENGDVITIVNKNPLKKAYIVEILNRIGETKQEGI
jgi:predicted RNA binding protein YcfA (HicA-like mRNA interferase family)